MIGIRSYRLVFAILCTLFALEAFGQISPRLALPDESPSGTDPGMGVDLSRAIRFSGVIDAAVRRGPQTVGMTFALYGSNGETLWMETQNVAVDEQGHYSVLLGSQSTAGMPPALFRSGTARMLGVRVENSGEQLLVLGSSPYAVSAQNANELGGRPAGEFVSRSELRDQVSVALKDLADLSIANGSRLAASTTVGTAASGGNGNGNGTPANPNAEILDAIASLRTVADTTNANVSIIKTNVSAILAKLNEPERPNEFKICGELGAEFELGLKEAVEAQGTAAASAGAVVFSNGGEVKAEAKPSIGQRLEIKAALSAPKLEYCFDILAFIRNRQAAKSAGSSIAAKNALTQSSTGASALADAVERLDQGVLAEKMAALASQLQLTPDGVFNVLDIVGNLSPGKGPFSVLEAGSNLVALSKVLPMPPQVRSALQAPGDLLGIFDDIRTKGICNVSLPDVLRKSLDPICALAASEPFKPLLLRVDGATKLINEGVGDVKGAVGNVQKAVDTVAGVIDDIKDALPISGDCKFFCK